MKFLSKLYNVTCLDNVTAASSTATMLRDNLSINVPSKSQYVSQFEYNQKVELNKAKFKKLKLTITFITVGIVVGLSVALAFTYATMNKKVTEAGGFSCVYQNQSTFTENNILTYDTILDSKKFSDLINHNLRNGTFVAEITGTYSLVFQYQSIKGNAGVSLMKNNKMEIETSSSEGRSEGSTLYLGLNATDTLELKCNNCNQIRKIHFCVALINL